MGTNLRKYFILDRLKMKVRGILREFLEILGKYSILDIKCVGSKGLNSKFYLGLPIKMRFQMQKRLFRFVKFYQNEIISFAFESAFQGL